MINLGDKVKCRVSGFTGIAIAKCEYLNGCIQYGVKSKMKEEDGEMPKTHYIDNEQLEVIEKDVVVVDKKDTGGEMPDCPIG